MANYNYLNLGPEDEGEEINWDEVPEDEWPDYGGSSSTESTSQ